MSISFFFLTVLCLREEVVINLDDDKGTTFGALRQGRGTRLSSGGGGGEMEEKIL